MVAGFVATLVLSAFMILNGAIGALPQMDIIRLLTALGTLSVPAAWMDHFIVGVAIWGLLFAAFDALTPRLAYVIKGLIFGVFAWLAMMVAFLPLAGAGFFGSKLDNAALLGLLVLHLIYGAALGATYGFLSAMAPLRVAAILPKGHAGTAGAEGFTISSTNINDHVESSNPSGRTMLIAFGSLVALAAAFLLAMHFRIALGL
jgi:hypothetical protein